MTLVANGQNALTVDGTSGRGVVLASDGLAGRPAYSFINDTNTGIYRFGDDQMTLVANGQDALTIDGTSGTGRVTIGPAPINPNGNNARLRVVEPDDGTGRFFYTGFFENRDNSSFNAAIRAEYRGTDQASSAIVADASGGVEDNYGVGIQAIADLGPAITAQSFRGPDSLVVIGNLRKTSGNFEIDHPLDPKNKILRHSFVESPEMILIYKGKTKLAKGKA